MSRLFPTDVKAADSVHFAGRWCVWLDGDRRQSYHVEDRKALAAFALRLGKEVTGKFVPDLGAFASGDSDPEIEVTKDALRVAWAALRVKDMKEVLRAAGLKVSGKKAELVDRLAEARVVPPTLA